MPSFPPSFSRSPSQGLLRRKVSFQTIEFAPSLSLSFSPAMPLWKTGPFWVRYIGCSHSVGKRGFPLAHERKITVADDAYKMCGHHMRVPLFLSPFGPSQSWFHTWCCRCCSCSARHSLYLSRATSGSQGAYHPLMLLQIKSRLSYCISWCTLTPIGKRREMAKAGQQ